jgi:hypothetical protein
MKIELLNLGFEDVGLKKNKEEIKLRVEQDGKINKI